MPVSHPASGPKNEPNCSDIQENNIPREITLTDRLNRRLLQSFLTRINETGHPLLSTNETQANGESEEKDEFS